ncbi:uncharacterized protein LOC126898310 [Daktulosphaira vitifoliae]|uniref:uncharacterized protein LOC126898310 n=1 Tax=Daktulosphaira vitifoliae TaxID=58002 RepID=UPI0021A9955A|nr:uncharacterized protein LOC126898310 [Daktulosphaira vitifoliae]
MQCVVMGIGDAKSRGYRVPVRVKYGRSACQIPESMSSIKYIIADTWSNFLCSVSTSSFPFPCNRGDPLICRGRQLGITSYGYSTKTFVGAEETNCGNQDIQIRHLLIVDYVKWIVSTISNMTSDNVTTTTTAKLSTITSVGKSTFNPNDFPYLVYLKGNAGEPVCGGSLISPIHVLTSAYCISRSTNITVHLSVEEDQISYGRPRVHPDYALRGMNANIGIIVLEVPFVVENYVKLAEFSKLSNNKKVISHFCVVIIKRPLKQHYFVPVNVKYGPKACRKPGKQETYLRNWDAYFCAQFDDKNFLNEEIGDPLICNGLQYGIASHHWLIPSGKDIKKEFHYMRVNNFKQWIDEVTMPLSSSGSILSVVSVCYIVLSRSILSIMESCIKKNYFK